MTPSRIQAYADMQEEVEYIASCIIKKRVELKPKNFHQAAWRYTPKVYLDHVEFIGGDASTLFIHYYEDWGQSGHECGKLEVSVEEFCDPKYLLDINE